MGADAIVICLILVVNAIVAVICLVYCIQRKRKTQGIALLILMLAFPVVAPVMIGIGNVARIVWKLFGVKEINYQELTFSKERMHLMAPADIQKSLNTVAVEEALIESDLSDRRKTFVDLLKDNDDDESMPLIRRSVENADTEIAHYAASFVASTVAALKATEEERYKELEEELTPQKARAYIKHIEKMALSNFVPQIELATYADRLIQVAESYYRSFEAEMSDDDIQSTVNALEHMGRKTELAVWVNRAYQRAWTSLVCFKICANYYFKMQDREHLFGLIEQSKRHSLSLDEEALGWIRMFNTEAL